MSKISTIYDALITGIESRLTTHRRIPYPYEPEKNNEQILDKGYGLMVGPVTNTQRELCDRIYLRRTFSIILTERFWATSQDASGKATTEKAILESMQTLYSWLEKVGAISTDAKIATVTLDDGIQVVGFGTDFPFYQLTSSVEIEYFESLEA